MSVRLEIVASDDSRVAALLTAYADDLAARGIVLHQGEGGSVTPDELRPPRGTFRLALLGDQPIGCGGVRRLDDETAEIKRMYVSPSARGKGVARTLLRALEDDARGFGHTRCRLDTGPGMDEALGLYRASGYVEISDYNANPHAGHWFEKTL